MASVHESCAYFIEPRDNLRLPIQNSVRVDREHSVLHQRQPEIEERWRTERPMKPEERTMNRRSFLLLGATCCGGILVACAGGARAMKLPTSTLTVNVLSMDRQSFDRQEFKEASGRNASRETTSFVAKARVQTVLQSDHNLSPGVVIEIRYDVVVRQPRLPGAYDHRTLKTGETVTLTVYRGHGAFRWRQ